MAVIVESALSDGNRAARDAIGSSVCAIGVFDGVHLGHRYLIDKAIERARVSGTRTTVITFDKDPDEFVSAKTLKKLMTNEARIAALAELDVDTVIVLRFDAQLAAMQPDDFLEAMFGCSMPIAVYVGEDFRFGKGAQGDLEAILSWAQGASGQPFEVCAVELMEQGGEPITSTRIRKLLEQARLQEALDLLGHPYALGGPVIHGRGQGAGFGICTADLMIGDAYMVAADGVYAAWATVGQAKDPSCDPARYMAAVSIGIPPTFEHVAKANVEAHLLDFEGDIYGDHLTLDIRHYLRPLVKFESTDDLISTISADIGRTRQLLGDDAHIVQ